MACGKTHLAEQLAAALVAQSGADLKDLERIFTSPESAPLHRKKHFVGFLIRNPVGAAGIMILADIRAVRRLFWRSVFALPLLSTGKRRW